MPPIHFLLPPLYVCRSTLLYVPLRTRHPPCPLSALCHFPLAYSPSLSAHLLFVALRSPTLCRSVKITECEVSLSPSHAASSHGRSHSYQPSVSPVDTKVSCHDRPPVHCCTWHVAHTQHQRVVGNWEVCHSFRRPECHRASIWGSEARSL